MKLKRQSIVLVLFAALVLGFVGSYVGISLAQPNKVPEQGPTNEGTNTSVQLKDFSKVIQAFNMIKHHYIEDLDDQQLLEGAIQGMLDTLEDPYSSYLDPEQMGQFQEQIESSFEGIGAEVSMVNGVVTIIAPIKDSPAEAASLRPNDQIIKIDHNGIEGLDLQEAVNKIRGEKGSEVVLEIRRPGVTETFEVSLIRDEIPLETVYADSKTIEGRKTGIIEITSFSETTAQDFSDELKELEDSGMEGLVIDVRGNPGGLLDSVEDILEHFIPEDIPYIQMEDQQGQKTPYYTNLDKEKEYPITVIIDEGSASASEILAVALKEIGHEVVGTTSFGKGTVQNAIPLDEDGSTIKLTIRKWLSPQGNWIDEKGVEPTVEVKQPDYYYTHPIQLEEPLAYNDVGSKVENIQKMLTGLGHQTERVDGFYDENTEAAVKSFQRDHGLDVTGKVDEKTAGQIESKVIEEIRNGDNDQQLEKALNIIYE